VKTIHLEAYLIGKSLVSATFEFLRCSENSLAGRFFWLVFTTPDFFSPGENSPSRRLFPLKKTAHFLAHVHGEFPAAFGLEKEYFALCAQYFPEHGICGLRRVQARVVK